MKTTTKIIGILSSFFAFEHAVIAESLYTSKIAPRLTDLDKDGVIAARDLCPETPANAAVDNSGCPKQKSHHISMELNILFDTGKAEIKREFYGEIKKLADFLKKFPDSSVVIEGHTDNRGSAKLNQELSQKRASAIAAILIDSFRVPLDRVKGIGYGESRPIDSNESETGRERNRRVVAEVSAQKTLSNERWTIYSVDKRSLDSTNNKS